MAKLPLLTAKELSKVLLKMGFVKIRQEGSHVFFQHPTAEQRLFLIT